jgi:hypothetical protein
MYVGLRASDPWQETKGIGDFGVEIWIWSIKYLNIIRNLQQLCNIDEWEYIYIPMWIWCGSKFLAILTHNLPTDVIFLKVHIFW